jgi:hypothetical protein
MADTYFISRAAFPTASHVYRSDEQFGQYFLTDQECGELFARDTEERVFNPETGEHDKVDARILVNIAPEGAEPQLIVCDPSRKVVRAIVERETAKLARLEAAAVRKESFLKQAKRIRSDFNVDVDAREAELDAPAFNGEFDNLSELIVDEICDPTSPLALAIANA